MKGKLYGIGVGPGDPDMMTLRAAALIRTADCICLPQSPKEKCRAYRIARQAVPELENRACVCFDFTMTRDEAELSKIHQGIYGEIRKLLTGPEQPGRPAGASGYQGDHEVREEHFRDQSRASESGKREKGQSLCSVRLRTAGGKKVLLCR